MYANWQIRKHEWGESRFFNNSFLPNSYLAAFNFTIVIPAIENLYLIGFIRICAFLLSVKFAGFIGGNRTREGALEMARKSMQHAADEEKKEEV